MSPQQRRARDEQYETMVMQLYEIAGVQGLDYEQMDAIIAARCRATGRTKREEVEAEHRRLAENLAFA